jgi:alkylation response protein AidB-like acyl-CoA dehydrogenase
MVSFELGEDVALLQGSVRELCQRQIVPQARAWDAAGRLPPSILRELGQMGLLGLRVSEADGGAGLSMAAAAAILEELAAADGAVALTVAIHNFSCLGHLVRRADASVRQSVLPRLVSGEALGAWAMAEPGVGSDPGSARATVRHEGREWVIRGRKSQVVQGGVADVLVVVASTDPEQGSDGLASFLIDRAAPGVRVLDEVRTLGMRAAATVDLRLEDVRVPEDRCLARPGLAQRDMREIEADSRIAHAAIACGLARAAIDASRAYAREREQFGRPIADFQAIQWKLADMATGLDAARLLVQHAAWERDRGLAATESAARAKLFAASRAVTACSEALQIHGGYGYTEEFPVERMLRDARYIPIAEGTDEIQRIVLSNAIARRFAST